MLDHYLEIKVLPDPEFKETVLMNALFAKLHRTLAQLSNQDIGVSFPDFSQKSLGARLRLHGSDRALTQLMELGWMSGLRDYTSQTNLHRVPVKVKYRVVKRVQTKSSVERLLRRSVKKGWLTTEAAQKKLLLGKERTLDLPFLQLRSGSTAQHFRLFIRHDVIVEASVPGVFNAYGLSQTATIPWF